MGKGFKEKSLLQGMAKYFSLMELKNKNFGESGEGLRKHLSGIVKNV